MSFFNITDSSEKKNFSNLLIFDKNSERAKRRISQMQKRKAILNTTDSIKIESTVQSSIILREDSRLSNGILQKSEKSIQKKNESSKEKDKTEDENAEVNISDLDCTIEDSTPRSLQQNSFNHSHNSSFIKLNNQLAIKKINMEKDCNSISSYLLALNEDIEKKRIDLHINDIIQEERERESPSQSQKFEFSKKNKNNQENKGYHNKNSKSQISLALNTIIPVKINNKKKCILNEYSLFHLKKTNRIQKYNQFIHKTSVNIKVPINKSKLSYAIHTRNNTMVTSPNHLNFVNKNINVNNKKEINNKIHKKTKTSLIFPSNYSSNSSVKYTLHTEINK